MQRDCTSITEPLLSSLFSPTMSLFCPFLPFTTFSCTWVHDKLSPLQSLLATFRILNRRLFGEEQRERERKGDHQGLQVALVSRNRNFAGMRERRVYMESSLSRTRTEIATLAGWFARHRFRLLQYLSCCKLDVPLIMCQRFPFS